MFSDLLQKLISNRKLFDYRNLLQHTEKLIILFILDNVKNKKYIDGNEREVPNARCALNHIQDVFPV